jgi:hypothetical protein
LDDLLAGGIMRVLISGRPDLLGKRLDAFDRVIEVRLPDNQRLANELETTCMSAFFASAIEAVLTTEQPVFLVLDSPGLSDLWDAPYSYRLQLVDDGDPAPSVVCLPPAGVLQLEGSDPDQFLDWQAAFGGQVLALDQLLGILLAQIDRTPFADSTLFCVTSLRGFPLGEHGVVGYAQQILYNESIHVPLIIRWPKSMQVLGRSQMLVQPGSLFELFCDWHRLSPRAAPSHYPLIEPKPWFRRDRSAIISKLTAAEGSRCALQTQAWKYINDGKNGGLFVRPDDIWDQNDIASLCPLIIEKMQVQLTSGLRQLSAGQPPEFELDNELANGVE